MKTILFILFLALSVNSFAGTRVLTSEEKLGTTKPEACKKAIDSRNSNHFDVVSVECNCEENVKNPITPWRCIAIFLLKN